MPNIAHISGHGFNSYLATAAEQVFGANMAAMRTEELLMPLNLSGDSSREGWRARRDGSTRREERK